MYLLGGAGDTVPQDTQRRLAQVLPQAQIVTMPGPGHYPGDEEPDKAVAIIKDFLEDAPGGAQQLLLRPLKLL